MKKTIAVIGLGEFGMSIVEELARLDADVIAVDLDESKVVKAAELVPTAFIADCTDIKALKELDIQQAYHVIIAFGNNIPASILATVSLVELGVKHITVRVDNEYYAPILKRLGANDVISPQRMAGIGLANRLENESFVDYYSLGGTFSVVKVSIRDGVQSKTIAELNPRNSYNVNLILISRKNRIFAPKATDSIEGNDILFIVGKTKDIERFNRDLNK